MNIHYSRRLLSASFLALVLGLFYLPATSIAQSTSSTDDPCLMDPTGPNCPPPPDGGDGTASGSGDPTGGDLLDPTMPADSTDGSMDCLVDPLTGACLPPPDGSTTDCHLDPLTGVCLPPPDGSTADCAIDPTTGDCLPPPDGDGTVPCEPLSTDIACLDSDDSTAAGCTFGDISCSDLLDPMQYCHDNPNDPLCEAPDPSDLAGYDADDIDGLLSGAFSDFTADHLANLDPDAIASLDDSQLAALPPEILDQLTPEQIAALAEDVIDSLTPDQFDNLTADTLGGLTSDLLGELASTILGQIDPTDLANFDPEEIRNMSDEDFARFITNLDATMIDPTDVDGLLPPGWTIDTVTGELVPPDGAELSFRELNQTSVDGLSLPDLPDFNSGLGLGGQGSDASILDGLDGALDAANLGGFSFDQAANGILTVGDDNAGNSPLGAFFPDTDNIVQAPDGYTPGLSLDAMGNPVLTTDDGYQIPLNPSLADPAAVLGLVTGLALNVGDDGDVSLLFSDAMGGNGIDAGASLMGIPNPLLETSDLAPGIYRETNEAGVDEVLVVNADGTAQRLTPTFQSADEFADAAALFPGVANVQRNADGTISLELDGQLISLRADIDVTFGDGGQQDVAPELFVGEDGNFYFRNSDNSVQQFSLAADATN